MCTDEGLSFGVRCAFHFAPSESHQQSNTLKTKHSDRRFIIKISYLEIYKEVIKDLLCISNNQLKISMDPKLGPFVKNLTEVGVRGTDPLGMCLKVVKEGMVHRNMGSTKMNEKSSRSHTIFRIYIESRAHRGLSDASERKSTSSHGKSPLCVLKSLANFDEQVALV